jgi:DNA repair protein RadC
MPPSPPLRAELPRERLARDGPAALGDAELLAVLLRHGSRGEDVLTLSRRVLSEAGALPGLARWRLGDFRRLRGLGPVKALQLVAAVELSRRLLLSPHGEAPLLDQPAQVRDYLLPLATGLEVEKFWVLCLNRRHRLLRRVELTSGTAHATLAHPREVFGLAVREGASAIVCAHNHPSGDPAPSAPDVQVTRLLRDSGRTLDIELLDHVILGRAGADPLGKGYYSFREAGVV